MKNKIIAIYSGEIPSTTFIERLVVGLADSGAVIYLFGKQNKKVKYPKNIKLFTYSNRFSKLMLLVKYAILLRFFKSKEKKKLDTIIAEQSGSNINKKIKYYPVLYHKPAVFHLQWAKGIEDWLWVKEFGIKYVLSLRGTHISISPIANLRLKKKYEDNFSKIDGFHAVSKAILKEARNYEPNLKNANVIYSGLNLDKLPFTEKKSFNEKIKILSIGRSHWLKGYQDALDACLILKDKKFSFNYTIIGIDKDEELIFQKSQLKLEDEVTFHKSVPFAEIIMKINKADVVLLPSIEEGIANVVLEAMALGTIVISTKCGGMEEVVKKGKTGFIVDTRSPEQIANAVLQVSDLSLEEYNIYTRKARFMIENQHTESKMLKDMNALYNSVLNE
ncbi:MULTISPECIES: glycosyltransferase family 4 protein [Flavobacterium]|uniref:Glycosyltransferase family 4 protein n=1 Tax=Flavobacterium jumunjinense TaxID=998845 RepID=A0ABV5GJ30_9FLAO|nr:MULTISPECIES: glycosyltransferase family 4 protein [Flavobacterium]